MIEHPWLVLISFTCVVTALAFLAGWRFGTWEERTRCMAVIKDFNRDLAPYPAPFSEDAQASRRLNADY